MSEEETARSTLKVNFERFDRDANGRIDRAEFAAILQELGAGLSEREADAAFADIDADGDGGIDFDELSTWWKLPSQPPPRS